MGRFPNSRVFVKQRLHVTRAPMSDVTGFRKTHGKNVRSTFIIYKVAQGLVAISVKVPCRAVFVPIHIWWPLEIKQFVKVNGPTFARTRPPLWRRFGDIGYRTYLLFFIRNRTRIHVSCIIETETITVD